MTDPYTDCVHAGMHPDPATGAVMPALHLATTFERGADGSYPRGYSYSREANPNRLALEQTLAQLEGGVAAFALPSGMAAANTMFAALDPGDHVVAPSQCYYGIGELLRGPWSRWGLEVSFVDLCDLAAVRAATQANTRLIWAESPANPLLRICDLAALAEIAHAADALLAVDNSAATPLGQQPLALGADVVMHSTTKYLAGHCDALGGALVVGHEGAVSDRLREQQKVAGIVPSPFDCWLIRRGILTLGARMEMHARHAQAVAEFLNQHPRVTAVHYPGLQNDPGHALASRQMKSFGGLLSFQIDGDADAALRVAARTQRFTRATSFGGPESLIEHRASIEGPHAVVPPSLLRLSVGLESIECLIADLAQALEGE